MAIVDRLTFGGNVIKTGVRRAEMPPRCGLPAGPLLDRAGSDAAAAFVVASLTFWVWFVIGWNIQNRFAGPPSTSGGGPGHICAERGSPARR
ncbi:hypothetical protein [Streptomyces sp. NPDC001978]|uniref:hypothetical protein n=1 Tax=Streptomyces sp. NPDC001978 TaxID=3364627 RepID=UPI00367CA983